MDAHIQVKILMYITANNDEKVNIEIPKTNYSDHGVAGKPLY